MSGRNNTENTQLDLKLNLSTPRGSRQVSSPEASPARSCVSSEDSLKYSSSPEATTSMVLVGCPRCLMYVMLSESDPKCPKCKSSVLLDFLGGDVNKKPRK
ncbi:hypothetical protein Nepgr_014022 [Nepenthes gracilis]|uniref:GIR1-like zinc ribbon domain-containing protein n=1 Tax=Nepenthes gracilis TaxID=150966 RepID=A0AAD3XPX1_NEPGR|nr:hypothetical protein Nepgr_014022 [Nepenthes gracilis]